MADRELRLYASSDFYPGSDGPDQVVTTCEACEQRRIILFLAPCPGTDGRHPLHRHVMCDRCLPEQHQHALLLGGLGAIAWLN